MTQPINVDDHWQTTFFDTAYEECFRRLGKFASTDAEVRDIVCLLGLGPDSRILDIPCGFGRHSGPLFDAGCHVVGVDSSLAQLALARAKNPGPVYVESDMRTPPAGPFDAVLNLWTSFGYLPTAEDDAAALRSWHSVLAPGGRLLMELTDLERAQFENRNGQELVSTKEQYHSDIREEASFDWTEQMAYVRYTFRGASRSCRTRIYARSDLESLFANIGFKDVQCFGDFKGNRKEPANRLVICGRKG